MSLPGRSVRCPVCGMLSDGESNEGKAESHGRAWWCFGLGMCCLPLLVLALAFTANRAPWPSIIACVVSIIFGATAIYFGIVALLRMRYRKATSLTKIAAVVGSLSGGCFGLVLGGFVAAIALVVFVIMQTSESANEPEAAFAMYQKMVHFDLPDDSKLKPFAARSSPLLFARVDFRDNEDRQKSNAWLRIARFPRWVTVNRAQFTQMLQDDIYGVLSKTELTKLESEKREWIIEGENLNVTKNTWKHVETNSDGTTSERLIDQYFVLTNSDELTHGLALVHDKSLSNLTEEEIEQIFASFKSLR